MDRYFLTGLAMLEASILQFRVALPRRGEVATFLRHREGQQAVYIVMLTLVFGSMNTSLIAAAVAALALTAVRLGSNRIAVAQRLL